MIKIRDEKTIDWLIGSALGLIALIVYCLTLSSGAYPGESANLIVQHTGLFPLMSPDHPIWSGVVWLISKIHLNDIVFRLNIYSFFATFASSRRGVAYGVA